MEVSVRGDLTALQHDRVVDDGGQFTLCNQLGMSQGVTSSACHLRRTAQRVGILHNTIAMAMGLHYLASLKCCKHICRASCLARVWSKSLVKLWSVNPVGAHLPLDAHGGNHITLIEQHLEISDGHDQHAEHAVGAIDKRQPFFFGKLYWFDASCSQ